MPRISVVMPAFNAAAYIDDAIQSILAQTYHDFEFIIIDDGSTDATRAIINTYTDARLLVLAHETQQGIVQSLNYGIQAASGEYIARMDADDISLSERFAKQVAFLDKSPQVAYVATATQGIDALGKLQPLPTQLNKTATSIRWVLHWSADTAHSGVMLRRNLFTDAGFWYDQDYPLAEDFDLWTRLAQQYDPGYVPDVLHHVRFHERRTTRQRRDTARATHQRIMQRELTRLLQTDVSNAATDTITRLAIHHDASDVFTADSLEASTMLITAAYRQFLTNYQPNPEDMPHILFWTQKILGLVLRAMVRQRNYGLASWHLRTIPPNTRYSQIRKFVKYHLRPISYW